MNPEKTYLPGGQEGIIYSADKKPLGDREFHEKAMLTDHAAEQEDLEAISKLEAELAERQVIGLAKVDAAMGKRGYKALIRLYPDHPNRATWEKESQG